MLYQDGIEYYIHVVAIVRDDKTTEKLSTVRQQREKPERGNESGSSMSGEMVKRGIRVKKRQ